MRVTINGKPEEVQARTVMDLLAAKEIEPRMVAVERNGAMLQREQLEQTALAEGDEIEFLFFMGGGCTQTLSN